MKRRTKFSAKGKTQEEILRHYGEAGLAQREKNAKAYKQHKLTALNDHYRNYKNISEALNKEYKTIDELFELRKNVTIAVFKSLCFDLLAEAIKPVENT